jgi:hypothetical protein
MRIDDSCLVEDATAISYVLKALSGPSSSKEKAYNTCRIFSLQYGHSLQCS